MAPSVTTSLGRLQGDLDHGCCVFRGVPFAQPPVGALRWRPPQPLAAWAGVRDASSFSPSAVQRPLAGGIGDLIGIPAQTQSEDCLYLNVWTPACDDRKRPVLVWIHGGGNTVGSGTQPRIDGRRLALAGDVVVVTLNYRLGVFGWLHAPVLGAYGNEGLLDQTAALFWVRREIAAFGGDPANVTVFGQSAGGFDIAHLMAMPAATGAFDKAIPMSGSLIYTITKVEARQTAEQFMLRFGGWNDPERLRSVSADDLLDYQSELTASGFDARFGPTADGYSLGLDAEARIGAGIQTTGMPLLIGHTKNEFSLFANARRDADGEPLRMSDDDLLQAAAAPFGRQRAEAAVRCYQEARAARGESTANEDVFSAMMTDSMFRIPAVRTAEAQARHTPAVWSYRFDYPSPAEEGRLGACHSLDIPFVWGTYDAANMRRFCGEASPQLEALSETMMQTWLAFARTGDPNNERLPAWPTYSPQERAVMTFHNDRKVVLSPDEEERAFWAALPPREVSRSGG